MTANSAHGDQYGFRAELWRADVPSVMALKPSRGVGAQQEKLHTPVEAARALAWDGRGEPGDRAALERGLLDGHTKFRYATDARLSSWGSDQRARLVMATGDPTELPDKAA